MTLTLRIVLPEHRAPERPGYLPDSSRGAHALRLSGLEWRRRGSHGWKSLYCLIYISKRTGSINTWLFLRTPQFASHGVIAHCKWDVPAVRHVTHEAKWFSGSRMSYNSRHLPLSPVVAIFGTHRPIYEILRLHPRALLHSISPRIHGTAGGMTRVSRLDPIQPIPRA